MTEKKSHNKITFIFSKDMHDLLLPYIVSGRQPELTVSIPFDVFTFYKSAFYLYYKLCTCKNIHVTLTFRLLTKSQASCGCRDSTSNRLQLRRSKLGRQPCHYGCSFRDPNNIQTRLESSRPSFLTQMHAQVNATSR